MPSTSNYSRHVARIALALPEQRTDLGLSQRELAAASMVSATTIRRLERGGRVHPELVIRLAAALTMFDLYRAPVPRLDDDLAGRLVPLPRAQFVGRRAS